MSTTSNRESAGEKGKDAELKGIRSQLVQWKWVQAAVQEPTWQRNKNQSKEGSKMVACYRFVIHDACLILLHKSCTGFAKVMQTSYNNELCTTSTLVITIDYVHQNDSVGFLFVTIVSSTTVKEAAGSINMVNSGIIETFIALIVVLLSSGLLTHVAWMAYS
ncbi:hypothetical protein L210DRAFT_3507642 [Boletus edulis BED1]|uniref:Uncharacterized protein n=1 Tax=Boletus edulis BED1 TaxID=1328754 RepID=A0AAD4BJ86_BOLED|nr:hypothetical protein L210DRAFT_3507642 [Boletus edulis BED1]